MRAEEDIRPISYVKTHISDAFTQVNDTHRPLYVTQNGKPKGVILDTQSYEEIVNAIGLMKLVSQGVDDYKNNRFMEQKKFFKEFRKKHFNK